MSLTTYLRENICTLKQYKLVWGTREYTFLYNEEHGTDYKAYEIPYTSFIYYDRLRKTIFTKEEAFEMFREIRSGIKSSGVSIRELIMLEMMWLGTPSKDIPEVTDLNVNISKDKVMYEFGGEVYESTDPEIVADFNSYVEELNAGVYNMLVVSDDDMYVKPMQYDFTSRYFIKKSYTGRSLSVRNDRKLKRIRYLLYKTLERYYSGVCTEDVFESLVNGGRLYRYWLGGDARKRVQEEAAKFKNSSESNLTHYFNLLDSASKIYYG